MVDPKQEPASTPMLVSVRVIDKPAWIVV